MKIDARGSNKEPQRSNFALWTVNPPGGSKIGPRGGQTWSNSLFAGLRVPRGRFLKDSSSFLEDSSSNLGSWDHLGVLLARLGPILGRISPSLGGPGEAPGGHFSTFLGRPSRDLKNELLFVVFSHMSGLYSVLLFALCCLPCSVAGGVVHMQKVENSLVFVGRKAYAPCSGNARSNQF